MTSMLHKIMLLTTLPLALVVCSCEPAPGPADATMITPDTPPTCGDLFKEPEGGACVPCLADDHCTSGLVCHPTSHECVGCFSDDNCAHGVCLPGKGFCVQCFEDEHCSSGICDTDKQVCVGCGEDKDCDDGNVCTTGACAGGQCTHTPVADGQTCTADPCTLGDICVAGACKAGDEPNLECFPCQTTADCEETQFCRRDGDICDGEGVCAPRPLTCNDASGRVCGCDGVTYESACEANRDGMDVGSQGACPCGDNAACAGDQLCQLNCLDLGMCVSKSDCGGIVAPVCGCDAETYDNKCAAWNAGISDITEGACCVDITCDDMEVAVDKDKDGCLDACEPKCTPVVCLPGYTAIDTNEDDCADTCKAPDVCPDGQVEALVAPKSADGTTDCNAEPEKVCAPCVLETGPMCGCDDVTYSSACAAHNEGVAIAAAGACGCATNEDCANGQACVNKQCACLPVVCPPGEIGVDTDGNTCADTCIQACETVCDCYAAPTAAPKDWLCEKGACYATVNPSLEANLCPGPAECTTSAQCGPQAFCKTKACGDVGECALKPVGLCPDSVAVCGCDGVNYASACAADKAGASFEKSGCCPFKCASGELAKDSDKDGCNDVCEPCPTLKCDANSAPQDLDGDGCVETCVSTCPELPACPDGTFAVDTDADGCNDDCVCKDIVSCEGEKLATDSTNNGCADICVCPGAPKCDVGLILSDSNDDDCADTCVCEKNATCDAGLKPVDTTDNGCTDTCVCVKEVTCDAGLVATDTTKNGCDDTCVCDKEVECGEGLEPTDTTNNGCDDTCVCENEVQCF